MIQLFDQWKCVGISTVAVVLYKVGLYLYAGKGKMLLI